MRWSKKDLENLSTIDFAIAILQERQKTTTNYYSFLNQKITKTIYELEQIKINMKG